MKKLLLFASALALLTGCASNPDYGYRGAAGTANSATDAGYGSGIAPDATRRGRSGDDLSLVMGATTTFATPVCASPPQVVVRFSNCNCAR